MQSQKGDHVAIRYVGRTEDGRIFDLNDEEVIKKEGLDPKISTGETIVCLGERDMIPGLDEFLIGQEIGKELRTTILPEQAFGKRDAALIKLIPLRTFKENNISPFPGLRLTLDGLPCTVKTNSGGRVLVDFNHLLAGRTLDYTVTMLKKVEGSKEQASAFLRRLLHLKEIETEDKEGTLTVHIKIPENLQESLAAQLRKRSPAIKNVLFKPPLEEHKKL